MFKLSLDGDLLQVFIILCYNVQHKVHKQYSCRQTRYPYCKVECFFSRFSFFTLYIVPSVCSDSSSEHKKQKRNYLYNVECVEYHLLILALDDST